MSGDGVQSRSKTNSQNLHLVGIRHCFLFRNNLDVFNKIYCPARRIMQINTVETEDMMIQNETNNSTQVFSANKQLITNMSDILFYFYLYLKL